MKVSLSFVEGFCMPMAAPSLVNLHLLLTKSPCVPRAKVFERIFGGLFGRFLWGILKLPTKQPMFVQCCVCLIEVLEGFM